VGLELDGVGAGIGDRVYVGMGHPKLPSWACATSPMTMTRSVQSNTRRF
jgi:hypothetical protein